MRSYSRLTKEKSRGYALERNYSDIIVVSTSYSVSHLTKRKGTNEQRKL